MQWGQRASCKRRIQSGVSLVYGSFLSNRKGRSLAVSWCGNTEFSACVCFSAVSHVSACMAPCSSAIKCGVKCWSCLPVDRVTFQHPRPQISHGFNGFSPGNHPMDQAGPESDYYCFFPINIQAKRPLGFALLGTVLPRSVFIYRKHPRTKEKLSWKDRTEWLRNLADLIKTWGGIYKKWRKT